MKTKELYSLYLEQKQLICTDTRKIEKGAIFFALKGDSFNGNTFAKDAIDKGCSYAIIDDDQFKYDKRYILVPDVLNTIQQLATYHRKQLNIPIIAITGTNGKTTTKELISSVLKKKYIVHATSGNYNNHLGVPLTLLHAPLNTQLAIIEMGANHQSEIKNLCEIAQPTYGIITNIGKAHLEGFGSFENIIKTKCELYDYLKNHNGKAFVNAQDELLIKKSTEIETIKYNNNECLGTLISADPYLIIEWKTKKNTYQIKTQLAGAYNLNNIMASICIGMYFKVSEFDIILAIQEYSPKNRSQIIKTNTNTLLLDAYNANPSSMTVAIENFSCLTASNKIVILGDMLELADCTQKEHELIISLLQEKKFTDVYLVGSNFMKYAKDIYKTYHNVQALIEYIKQNHITNSLILIKGSRLNELEKIINFL